MQNMHIQCSHIVTGYKHYNGKNETASGNFVLSFVALALDFVLFRMNFSPFCTLQFMYISMNYVIMSCTGVIVYLLNLEFSTQIIVALNAL